MASSSQGVALDILLAQFDFELSIINRATYFKFKPEADLLTISCEELVVLKAFAGREQDWNDVRGIVVSNKNIDLDFVKEQLRLLVGIAPKKRRRETKYASC